MKTLDPTPHLEMTRNSRPEETTDPTDCCQHACRNGWHLTSLLCSRRRAAILGAIGAPGLWKVANGKTVEFAYPASILAGADVNEAEVDLETSPVSLDTPAARQAAMQAWAISTTKGKTPAGWAPPSEETLTSLLPTGHRNLRHGSIVREIEIVHEPAQLVLRVPLACADPGMPAPRRQWLRKLITSANDIWRLVRIGFAPDSRTIIAEVNLTGAPAAVLPSLLQASSDSLRWIVAGLADTMVFLSRAENSSRALDILPAKSASHTGSAFPTT